MKVYLVRHGRAVSPQADAAKPLSDEGRSEIEHVARTLKNMNISVSAVYHSGKLRAEESAMILAAALEAGSAKQTSGLAPNDEPEESLGLIEASEGDIMLVAHLPLLDRLLRVLVNPEKDEGLPEFGAGTMVAVEQVGDSWQIFRALGPHMIW
ncbi:MAG: phosphohistidine phosphatase SixA [Candidatus Glassbacteria bacterium]|nr:phosphohistidine phosphatase SixA [Candidatus Glassbacteria bacterium]